MMHALTSHLWQSTIFAGAAALLTLAFRANKAQVRYWLWIGASFKFLIPFAPLTSVGTHIHMWAPPVYKIAAATPVLSYATEYFSQPFLPQRPLPIAGDSSIAPWADSAIFGVWLCGFTALILMRFRKWRRIRQVVRASVSMAIPAPVEIRSSPGLLEPGVVGLIRPVLLLPQGIPERLTPSEMDAILAHELCHVRRRDNLLASIHMIVETIFWFHPLVWWIGARLLEERERACDEEVVSRGNHPDVYAEAILNVCKLYTASPLACVSGVTGANLKQRIEAILINRTGEKLNRARKLLLAAAAAVVVAGPLAIGMLHGGLTKLSAAPVTPESEAISFEVASVKPSTGPAQDPMFCIAGPCAFGERLSAAGSRVNVRFMSLYSLILTAYGIRPTQLSGPDWMKSQRFDIEAKMPEGASRKQIPEMLKALLSERFALAIHRDSRDEAVLALVVGKDGLKLPKAGAEARASFPETPGDQPVYTPQGDARALKDGGILITASEYGPIRGGRGSSGVMQWEYSNLTMPALAALLAPHLDLPVVDMTNLKDSYQLVFQNQRRQDGGASAAQKGAPQEKSPDVGNARQDDTFGEGLIRAIEKAGLKLEARRAPIEMIVVDHLEKTPAGN